MLLSSLFVAVHHPSLSTNLSLSVVPHHVVIFPGGLEMLMCSSCNPKLFGVRHIHYPVNPSSDQFHNDAVVPSSDHCRTETLTPTGEHCFTETEAPSSDRYCTKKIAPPSDHYCIVIVLPSSDRGYTDTVPPSSDHFCSK